MRVIGAVARVQLQMTRQNIQDLMPLISTPFFTLVAVAILKKVEGKTSQATG